MQSSDRSHASRCAILALSIASLLAGTSAHAATYTWIGPADEAWDTTSNNWDPAATLPWDGTNGFSNLAVFNTPALAAVVNGTVFANGITFDAAGTLSDGIITLGGATPLITVGDGITATIGSILDGTVGLTKIGTGTLTLAGVNTFSGTLNVAAGTLRATSDVSALGTGTLSLVGGALELAGETGLNFARNTTVAANSTITSDTFFLGFDGVTHTLGTLSIGAQTLTVTRGANAASGTGGITFGATTLTGNATFEVQSNARLTLGAITGAANGFTKSGAGALVLTGNNTHAGAVTISGGTLIANSNTAMGATTNTLTLGDANTGSNPVEFKLDTGLSGPNPAVNLGSIVTSNFGTSQTITVNSGSSLNANVAALATTLNLNGSVPLTIKATNTGPGSHTTAQDVNLRILGSGVPAGSNALILDGTSAALRVSQLSNASEASNFTGDVLLKGNVITQNRTYAGQNAGNQNLTFLNNDVVVGDGVAATSWTLVWGGETIGALKGPGNITLNNQNALNSIGLTIGNNGRSGAHSGVISGGFGIAKVGTGVQELSGANTYSGLTTLTNGTLKLTRANGGTWGNSNIAVDAVNSVTLQLNSAAAGSSWTFSKQINGGSANARIEKVGPGTVVLNPATGSSFATGLNAALIASAGKLYLNSTGFATQPAVIVGSGGTFGGTVTVGNIAVSNGGNLEGGYLGAGTLTAGNVTLGAIAADFSMLSGSLSTTAGYKPITVTNLMINGGNQSVVLNASGIGLVSGTYYDLLTSSNPISAPNADSVLAALKSNARAYTPNVNGNTIRLYYDADASVYWTGVESADWNSSATNWKLKGNNGDTQFLSNDVVEFRDNPMSPTVDISTTDVSPAVVTFTNTSATEYILQGAYGIAAGRINKTGNGTVIIANTNTTNGEVTLSGGLVTMSQPGGLGSGSLVMDGGALQYTGLDNSAWTRTVTVNAGGGKIDVQDLGATVSTSGALGGTGTLTKIGPGALAFSGAGAFGGNLVVSGGMLLAKHANALGTGAATLVLGDVNTGPNPVELKVDNGVSSAVTLAALSNSNFGTSQTVTINSGSSLGLNAAGLIATVNLDGTVPITFKATNTNTHGTAQDVNARFVGSGIPAGQTALILDGTAWNLRFSQLGTTSAASNFTGDVLILGNVITQGRTYLAAEAGNQNLTFLNNDVTVSGGATWSVVWGGETIGALNGSGTVNLNCQNALNNIGLTLGNNSRDGVFSGQLGNSWGIAKTGSGTQTLSGAGIGYTGATTVNGGRLALQDAYLFGSPSIAINAGSFELNFGMEFDWFVPTTISGVGNLEKAGTGKVILTGNSSGFAGPTKVDAGTLFVNGNLSGSAITVNNGTLGGSGAVGPVTVLAGGNLQPGDGIGFLQTGNLTIAGTFGVEIGGTSVGLTYDQLNVAGTVTLTDATLSLALNSFVPDHASLFFLISNDGNDAINGTFSGLNDGAIVDLGGVLWEISYDANFQNGVGDSISGGNDIALMAVPEPSSVLLGGFGIVAVATRRRRTTGAK